MNPRIIAGKYKNLTLDVAEASRPYTDRVKQSVFDTISQIIEGANVLDLYSGSGNLGIESISRGAGKATLVEKDAEAIKIIKKNLNKLESENIIVIEEDVFKFIGNINETFDIIFVDPPFEKILDFDLGRIEKLLKPPGVVVFKVSDDVYDRIKVPEDFEVIFTKSIGINVILYLQLRNQ